MSLTVMAFFIFYKDASSFAFFSLKNAQQQQHVPIDRTNAKIKSANTNFVNVEFEQEPPDDAYVVVIYIE